MEHSSGCSGGVVLGPEKAVYRNVQRGSDSRPYLDRVNAAAKLPPKIWDDTRRVRQRVALQRGSESERQHNTDGGNRNLRAHIIPKLGSLPLTEISTKSVQGFVAYLASGRSRKMV